MSGAQDGRREGEPVYNIIAGGVQNGPILQARYISAVFTVQLPPRVAPAALAGLPKPSPVFTGRDPDLGRLLRDLAPAVEGTRVVLVSAVSGLAGIGKSQLAVHSATEAVKKGWFPGGVLYINLLGYDPERRKGPEQALDSLLRALGIPDTELPRGLSNQERLYRTVLAGYAAQGRRILVVADNASSVEQALPLIPTDGSCAALVTSRHTLDGLDARLHDIGVLDEEASRTLLDEALRYSRGDHDTRITDDPEAAATIARLCAGLPLALRIAASLLVIAPRRPAADLAEELQVEHTRLDTLYRDPDQVPDFAVRAAFDLSYRLLGSDHARLFRLLPLNPGPDLSTDTASHMTGMDVRRAGSILQALADAHLVEPAQVWGRWGLHDLVRLYADEYGRAEAAPDDREGAQTRLHEHFLTTAHAAISHLPPHDGQASAQFADHAGAMAWLDQERANLIALGTARPPIGREDTTLRLATGLSPYLNHRRGFDDQLALTAAAQEIFPLRVKELIARPTQEALYRQIADRQQEAHLLVTTGIALHQDHRFEEALAAHRRASTIFEQMSIRDQEAMATRHAGLALGALGRYDEAIAAQQQAAAIYVETGNQLGEAMAMSSLGEALRQAGHLAEARDAHMRAISLFHEIGDHHRMATAMDNCAILLHLIERFEEAIVIHRYTITIHQKFGDRDSELSALAMIGPALFQVGQHHESVDILTDVVRAYQELGDRQLEGSALNNLAGYCRTSGNRMRRSRCYTRPSPRSPRSVTARTRP
ncbi:tetratricopeptide repeat protein [Streptomyces sp. NPDC091204]|uniref:tetratricopeptide repeat protein n=1 Tax=Streptomyces sp. NPDC091204 TaxID=3155299 RepID=UPI00344AB0E1